MMNARRLIGGLSSSLPAALGAVVLVAVLCTAAPAVAATPPEARTEPVSAVTTTTATLNGVVNAEAPSLPVEKGAYQFLYKATTTATTTECESGTAVPVPAGEYSGIAPEPFSQPVTGLIPDTAYVVCLLAENEAKQKTVGAPVAFRSALEVPEEAEATAVTASTATISAVLAPKASPSQVEEGGHYFFIYGLAANGGCGEEHLVSAGPLGEALEAVGAVAGQPKEKKEVHLTGLDGHAKYVFCMFARNPSEVEQVISAPAAFETPASAPAVISEVAYPSATKVYVEAVVNAENETSECHFQYGTASVSEHEVGCEQGDALQGGVQVVTVNLTGLPEGTAFKYQVLLKNGTGEGAGPQPEQQFTTAITPETPEPQAPSPLGATTATLRAVLNPHHPGDPGSFEFVYRYQESGTSAGCEGSGQQTAGGSALGHQGEQAEAQVENLLPNTTYTLCVHAHNEIGEPERTEAKPITFTTPPAPVAIESQSSADISTTEARLEAKLYDGNAQTSYRFEYGPAAGSYDASIPVPAGQLAAHVTGVNLSATATGLEPGRTYHWRVVASNTLPGQAEGADQTFTTLAARGTGSPPNCPNETRRAEQPFAQALPDCRAYEIVSSNTEGYNATDPTEGELEGTAKLEAGTVRAAVSGEAVTYASLGSFAAPSGALYESQILSRRSARGWTTQSITAPAEAKGLLLGYGYVGELFTPGLTAGLTMTVTAAPLAGEAPAYVPELYLSDFADRSYQLVSNFSPGEGNTHERYEGSAEFEGPFPMGASTDLSHVVFAYGLAKQTIEAHVDEWVGGRPFPVGVSNNAAEPGGPWVATVGNSYGGRIYPGAAHVWHAVSADGSRVVFAHAGELYVRVNAEQPQSPMSGEECLLAADACTVKLSAGGATYVGADVNDTRIFYREGEDLYEYDLAPGAVKGESKAITTNGKVQGVAEISEDGSYVYFLAKGALAGDATEQTCLGSGPGEGCNLYLYHEGETSFIATLSSHDGQDWQEGPGEDTSAVSPDGALLAFTSEDSLTGYDNEQAEHGDCERELRGGHGFEDGMCREVFLYDAASHTLACASCNPAGVRPVGGASLTNGPVGGSSQPRQLLDDGRVFFESSDALVPHASDGRINVYEYENGDVYAISNVTGKYDSYFLEASGREADGQEGGNVFFATADQLLPEDTGNSAVVYDARAEGGFPVASEAPACTTADACRTAPAPEPSVYGAPASATFSGPGNVAPSSPAAVVSKKAAKKTAKCAEGKRLSHGKCVKKKKPKQAKKAKRASRDRRTKS
jgi:hypothetical protein